MLPKLRINSERLRADFDRLSLIGATASGGINRLALSPEDLQARAWLADRIDDAGL
ncbi:Zn-dependent hydrolase, partial [Anaerolineae bacterium CFX9]|nr:Zn-dependent hydrolase [Anaerolineae bacterium CFX9]